MKILEQLKIMYYKWLKDISKRTFTAYDLYEILRKYCDDIKMSDNLYETTDSNTMKTICNLSPTKYIKYRDEIQDCDDHSFIFMGYARALLKGFAVGIVWADTPKGGHALNFCVTHTGSFSYIEPQNGRMFYDNSYKPRFMVI